jgi:hypothetical protein
MSHCNYSTHKVFSVFIGRCLTAASNGKRSPCSGFRNCPRPQLPASHFSQLQLSIDSTNNTKLKSKLRYDRRLVGQSVSVSITHLGPKIRCLSLSDSASLLMWGASLTRGRVFRIELLLVLSSDELPVLVV